MALFQPMGNRGMSAGEFLLPGDLIAGGESLSNSLLTTVGDGTWTGELISHGMIRRTGPVAAYADTTDTAQNIVAALRGSALTLNSLEGTSFRFMVQNTVAYANTVSFGQGVYAGLGTTSIAASLVRNYLFTIESATNSATYQCLTTNGSPDLVFVLPPGQDALPYGSDPRSVTLSPGMSVFGTGIPANAKILNLCSHSGGVYGVTLDQNATATSVSGGVSVVFTPRIRIDGLSSSTL